MSSKNKKGEREQTPAFIHSLLSAFGQSVTNRAPAAAVIISLPSELYPGTVRQINSFLSCLVRFFFSSEVRKVANTSTYPLKKVLPFSQ